MQRRIFLLRVLAAAALCAAASSPVRALDEGELTFCHFGPKVKVLAPATPEPKDPCAGTAKIQALLWECAPPEQTDAKVDAFRKRLLPLAEEECRRHCEARASGCRGTLIPPKVCGLQTDREDSVAMGKRMGCRKDCHGSAFIYCSLYDARFRTEDAELVAKQAPNCRCARPPEP